MKLDIGSSVLRAVVPSFPFGVARRAPQLGCCTLLHDDRASAQPTTLRTCDDERTSAPSRPCWADHQFENIEGDLRRTLPYASTPKVSFCIRPAATAIVLRYCASVAVGKRDALSFS
jgi:hypothetical protein